MLDDKLSDETEATEGLARVVWQLMGDARERLVYRAGIYSRSDILGYKPAPGDLAYPQKLEMMKSIADAQREKEGDKEPTTLVPEGTLQDPAALPSAQQPPPSQVISPADMHGLWYPPVRRTILCLSKLYKCLDPAVFQHLSQDVLAHCLESLKAAKDAIARNQTPLDAQLFLVKHVLILREQTTPLHQSYLQLAAAETASTVSHAPISFKETHFRLGKITIY